MSDPTGAIGRLTKTAEIVARYFRNTGAADVADAYEADFATLLNRLEKAEAERDEYERVTNNALNELIARSDRATRAEARAERVEQNRRDELAAAYEAGAWAVHDHVNGPRDPDQGSEGIFTEAAHDYAASITPEPSRQDREGEPS